MGADYPDAEPAHCAYRACVALGQSLLMGRHHVHQQDYWDQPNYHVHDDADRLALRLSDLDDDAEHEDDQAYQDYLDQPNCHENADCHPQGRVLHDPPHAQAFRRDQALLPACG